MTIISSVSDASPSQDFDFSSWKCEVWLALKEKQLIPLVYGESKCPAEVEYFVHSLILLVGQIFVRY